MITTEEEARAVILSVSAYLLTRRDAEPERSSFGSAAFENDQGHPTGTGSAS